MVKDKITLKKVISKLENMDESHKVKWVYSIVSALNDEFISQLFNETYEQGRFDEAMENTIKVKKVKIPDYMAHWLEYCKTTNAKVVHALILDRIVLYNYARKIDLHKLQEWLKSSENQITFIEAWLYGCEVVKEKHYYVAVPVGNGIFKRLSMTNTGTVYLDEHNYHSLDKLICHSRQCTNKLTEEAIKNSPLSWAWQFAKELEE